ncbi:MAG: hypothetical protein KDB39_13035 [Austwickia sp.]|nr:hypothetical protein [Actinomycetota bacterium]MCB1254133.1 hypothetical protein [Austwickia sp.]
MTASDLRPLPTHAVAAVTPAGKAATRVVASRAVPGTTIVFLLVAALGAAVSTYSVRTGHVFDYNDSLSHLTIARRVLDSASPGSQQLGTVWPPVPHLLLMPWAQSLWLWSTGAAGAIVGTGSLAAAAAALYRALARLSVHWAGRVAAVLVLAVNPSFLYLSSTALTEPVLVATAMLTIAALARWATSTRHLSGGELAVFAGLPAAAGCLTRYEGWATAAAATAYVLIVALQRGNPLRRSVVLAGSFVAPSIAAILAWLAYNFAMYGDPLDFARGAYSASAFNAVYRAEGLMTTDGSLGLTLDTYAAGVRGIAGVSTLLLATLGLLLMCLRWGLDRRALAVWVAAAPTAFLVYGLYSGQHIMMNEASLPVGAFNNRQALSTLPWLAMLVGVGTSLAVTQHWRRPAAAPKRLPTAGHWRAAGTLTLLIGVLTVQQLWWAADYPGRASVLTEAVNNRATEADRTAAASWLGSHYDGGLLLLDEAAIPASPIVGIPLRQQINRSDGDLFRAALTRPAEHVRWIFMHHTSSDQPGTQQDLVGATLGADPPRIQAFREVHRAGSLVILRRIEAP